MPIKKNLTKKRGVSVQLVEMTTYFAVAKVNRDEIEKIAREKVSTLQ